MNVLIYQLIHSIFKLVYFALWARIIISWLPHDRYNQIIAMLYKITDPILKPFQDIIPPEKLGGFDVSIIFVFLALYVLERFTIFILF
ncbi:YggT family protein [bacterium]|nr:YggT family protein [bacterium]